MTPFAKAAEYFLNKQYQEAYLIYASGEDRHAVFNAAMMEVFGRGVPQNLRKAEQRLQELQDSGLEEAAEPLDALKEYFRYADVYGQYKKQYLQSSSMASAAGMKRAKEYCAAAVTRLRKVPMFAEEENPAPHAAEAGTVSEEEKEQIRELLAGVYPEGAEDDLPKMLAVMQKAGFTKEYYGVRSLTRILPQLPFIQTVQNRARFVPNGAKDPLPAKGNEVPQLSEEEIRHICDLLAAVYSDGQEDSLPKMLSVLQSAGYTKERFGIKSLTQILPQLPFIQTEHNRAVFSSGSGAPPAVMKTAETAKPKSEENRQFYCFARMIRDAEDHADLLSVSGDYLIMLKKTAHPLIIEALQKGEYSWFRGTEGSGTVRPARANASYLASEAESFLQRCHAGNQISVPIRKKTDTYCLIELGPTLTGTVRRENVQPDYAGLQEKQICNFEILHCGRDENGEFQADLKLTGIFDESALLKKVDLLPETEEMRQKLQVPEKLADDLNQDPDRNDVIGNAVGGLVSAGSLKYWLIDLYDRQKKEQKVYVSGKPGSLEIRADLDLRDRRGVPLQACISETEDHAFELRAIEAIRPEEIMNRQVLVSDWKTVLNELGSLAVKENSDPSLNRRILGDCLKGSYYKAWLENKICEENGYGVFNTGLADNDFDPVYCLLKQNPDDTEAAGRKWMIAGFACRGKGEGGEELNRRISLYPEAPHWYGAEDAENLVFDRNREVHCDCRQLLSEGMDRLPAGFILEVLPYDEHLKQMYAEKRPPAEIRGYISSDARLQRDLEAGLKKAADLAVRAARWNGRMAVPVFDIRRNSVCLALPLYSGSERKEAAAALIIVRTDDGYQALSVWTAAMAFRGARLIAPPGSGWLQMPVQ